MATSIFITRGARNPAGTISVGINGVISKVPVGVDTIVGDDVLEALQRKGVTFRLSSVPRVLPGMSLLDGTGGAIAFGVNGVVGSIPVDAAFIPTTSQQTVIDSATIKAAVIVGGGMTITGTPAAATIGAVYAYTPSTPGSVGTRTFAFSNTAGLTANGLTFSTSTGAIMGTITGSAGTINGTITVTDSASPTPQTASLPVSIVVSAAATVTLGTLAFSTSFVVGTAVSGTVTGATAGSAIGGISGVTFSGTGTTRTYTGTPTTAGQSPVETLAGATGSPKTSSVAVSSGAITPSGPITVNFLFVGSSTPEKMFTENTGPANANVNTWNGTAFVPLGTAGGGATVFGDQMVQRLLAKGYSSVTVNLIPAGKGGTTVNDWVINGGSIRTNAVAAVQAAGVTLDGLIHICGLNDAVGNTIVSEAGHEALLDNEFSLWRGALGANLKIFIGTAQDYYGSTDTPTDNQFRWLHTAEIAICGRANTYFATHVYDLEQLDGTHMAVTSYPTHATRMAYNITEVLVGNQPNRGPTIASVAAVYATKSRATIAQSRGTDISTTDYLTGFEVSFDGGSTFTGVGVYAIREDATHLAIYHPASGGAAPTIRYMDAVRPNNNIVFYDNATVPMPASMTTANLVAPSGTSTADPSPPALTFQDTFDYTAGDLLTTHGWTAPATGVFVNDTSEVYGSVLGNLIAPFTPKTANYDVEWGVRARTIASGNTSVIVHYVDESNYLYIVFNSGATWQIAQIVNGSNATLATGTTPTPVLGQEYSLIANVLWDQQLGISGGAKGAQTSINLSIDGTAIYTAVHPSGAGGKVLSAKGKVGIRQSASAATSNTRSAITRFKVTDVFR